MKTLKHLAIILGSFLVFVACQKEFSFESGLLGRSARGDLQSVAGDCQPILINGEYIQDTTLTDSNYVTIQVNITTPGVYRISTDTVNGFYFKDSGVVTATGPQTIKLKGSGKPLLEQTTDFIVAFDSTFCLFTINVAATAVDPAVFTLGGAPNSCLNSTSQGEYFVGTALNSGNTVNVQVNVTTPGRYSITAGPTGGMTFIGQGIFTATGIQMVTLQGSGIPTTEGANTVPVSAGGGSCNVVVNVATGTPADDVNDFDSAWQFSQGSNFFHGFVVGAEVLDTLGFKVLNVVGLTPATFDTAFLLVANMGPTITTGTFSTATQAGVYLYKEVSDTLQAIYYADPSTTGIVSNVVISAYNPTTRVIQGTFAGNAKNAQNQSVPITAGKFTARID